MLGKGEQCGYESSCVLRKEFGEEICRICTAGPRVRRQNRNLRRGMWAATIMNLTAMAFNLVRAFTR